MEFTSDDVSSSDSDSDIGSTRRPTNAKVVRVMPVMDMASKDQTPKSDENGNKLVFRLATDSTTHIDPSIEMGDNSNSSSSSDLPAPDFLKSPSSQGAQASRKKSSPDFESPESGPSTSPASTSAQSHSTKKTPKSTPSAFSVLMSGNKGSTGKNSASAAKGSGKKSVKTKGSEKKSDKPGEKRPWPHVCDECGRHLANAQV